MRKLILLLLLIIGAAPIGYTQQQAINRIAHRGGVVDEKTDENSLKALTRAADQGYYMVELDVRQSKDGELVVHHDQNLKRFFGVDKRVDELLWKELKVMKSANNHQVQQLKTMLEHCKAKGLQVMIDLKVRGNNPEAWAEIYRLLQENDLDKEALIIPSEEATDYFRGKVKLSCTRAQIEDYKNRIDYSPTHYYLFANPSPADFEWAKAEGIQTVGVINYRPKSTMDYEAVAQSLIDMGVEYVQMDSRFDPYFVQKNSLRFNDKGRFKIVQFTDLHWDERSVKTQKTIQTMRSVLDKEKPDLILLTGDLPASRPAQAGWDAIASLLEAYQTPWTITLGNHDDEVGMSRGENFDYLANKPFFIGQRGAAISGAGNNVLPIYAALDNTIQALVYTMDTHNKPNNRNHGHYNWVQFDQINWYRKQSERFTKGNNGIPYPALTFIHIPVVEYGALHREPSTYVGNGGRGDGPGGLNSGLFVSFLEKGDVMGVFAGHNHSNDYIGKYMDVALGYGRTTGADAYGSLERGARVIVLEQGKRSFETWISTPTKTEFKYYYPSGITEKEVLEMSYKPADKQDGLVQGVNYKYYEGGRFQEIDDINKNGKLIRIGTMDDISISHAAAKDSFAYVFEGYLHIPEDAVCNFYTYSDDGSKLWIGDQLVVDNDGSHNERRRNGKIALQKGYHYYKIEYFDDYMGEVLEVGISSINIKEQVLPKEMLFR